MHAMNFSEYVIAPLVEPVYREKIHMLSKNKSVSLIKTNTCDIIMPVVTPYNYFIKEKVHFFVTCLSSSSLHPEHPSLIPAYSAALLSPGTRVV